MRHMPSMGVRAQARHAGLLDPLPQSPNHPLGSPVEQQAEGQGHGSRVSPATGPAGV
jgi:hypothetical protein